MVFRFHQSNRETAAVDMSLVFSFLICQLTEEAVYSDPRRRECEPWPAVPGHAPPWISLGRRVVLWSNDDNCVTFNVILVFKRRHLILLIDFYRKCFAQFGVPQLRTYSHTTGDITDGGSYGLGDSIP